MTDFGSWAPDLPPYGHDGLVIARNVYAGPLGYEPFRGWSAVTSDPTTDTWLGGGAFEESDGTIHLLAGTTGGVELYSGGTWSSVLAAAYTARWHFVQWADTVIGVSDGTIKPVAYNMAAGTCATLGGTPPEASMIAIVKEQVFLSGKTSAQSTVYWSANNSSTGWTAGTNQSGSQIIPDGGPITGLAGGEYALVFQQSAISIFEYVGTPLIYTRRKVSDAIGALTHGGIVQAGTLVFFLSNRGFYLFDNGELRPIGKDRVDRTFFAQYTVQEIQASLRAAIEPNLNLVIWSMPGKLWIYNWGAERWSEVTDTNIVGVTTGRTGYLTLDQIEAIYTGTDDTPGGVDDPIWQGGDPMLLVVHTDKYHYAFGATTYLAATLQAAKMEPNPGLDTHTINTRIVGNVASGATITLDCGAMLSSTPTSFVTTDLRTNGEYPILARGRYIQPKIALTTAAAWEYIQGIDIEGVAGGRA